MQQRLTAVFASAAIGACGIGFAGVEQAEEFPFHAPEPVAEIEDEFRVRILDVGGVYISGQPTEAGLRWAAANGVTTVICVRGQIELDNKQAVPYDMKSYVEELGLDWVHAPMPRRDYGPEVMEIVSAGITNAEGKVLLCCTVGARVSHVWGAYLVDTYDWNPADAYALVIRMTGAKPPFELLLDGELSYGWRESDIEST